MEFENRFNNIVKNVLGEIEDDSLIDSITFVELLVALQSEFKLKFSTQEFIKLRTLELIKKFLYEKYLSEKSKIKT